VGQQLAVETWEALFRAQVAVMRRLTGEFPPGLTITEYDVLFNLSLRPGRSARLRDLNNLLLLTQPSISRMVDRLVGRGLLAKRPDEHDGRGTVVTLTDAGYRRFLATATEHARSIDATLSPALSDDELTRLTDKLRAHVSGAVASE
jgi:DNA-binding MarR family transcriptional regulator